LRTGDVAVTTGPPNLKSFSGTTVSLSIPHPTERSFYIGVGFDDPVRPDLAAFCRGRPTLPDPSPGSKRYPGLSHFASGRVMDHGRAGKRGNLAALFRPRAIATTLSPAEIPPRSAS